MNKLTKRGSTRVVTGGVLVAAVAASQLVGAVTASAKDVSTYHPSTTQIDLEDPTGMAVAAGKFYVSDENTVKVFSASTKDLLQTITGVFGATSPVASADGSLVYVAEEGGSDITAISTATDSVAEVGTTAGCPRSLSVTATTVWYLAGCDAPYGVYTLPAETLAGPAIVVPGVTTNSANRTALRVDGSTLALAKGTSVDIYSIDEFDALTSVGTVVVPSTDGDIVIRGDDLFIADTTHYDYRRYSLSTGTLSGSYSAGAFPRALALSSDGAQLGLGVESPNDNGMFVFDTTSGVADVKGSVEIGESTFAGVTEVAFSADDSRLYGLAKYWTGSTAGYYYYIATSTTAAPIALDLDLSVTAAKKVGQPLTADATVTDGTDAINGASVTFKVESDGQILTIPKTTDSSGIAHLSMSTTYSGKISAEVDGDPDHIGATAAAVAYEAPSGLDIVMPKAKSVRHGVHYYKSVNDIAAAAKLNPGRPSAIVHGTLQTRKASGWKTLRTVDLYTNSHSVVGQSMTSAKPGVVFRFGFTFDGDQFSAKATAYSKPFAVKAKS